MFTAKAYLACLFYEHLQEETAIARELLMSVDIFQTAINFFFHAYLFYQLRKENYSSLELLIAFACFFFFYIHCIKNLGKIGIARFK